MWELIRANQRKSMYLFFLMGMILVLLGFILGEYSLGENGGIPGIIIAIFIWLIMAFVSIFQGKNIILKVSNAQPVSKDFNPRLYNVVEEMKLAANLPVLPKVYVIPTQASNAFAIGMKPENAAIVVTAGLLSKLNRDELQGVIAHEMSHIINRDILLMTFAGVLLGSITLLSRVFFRGMFLSGGKRYSSSKSSKSSGGGPLFIIAIIMAILAPILAQILYFAVSRKREFLADASAVRLTRYPEGLASALEKISRSFEKLEEANKITAPMFIINPFDKQGMALNSLASTHPKTADRIKILRCISQGVNLKNYHKAYVEVKGTSDTVLKPSMMKEKQSVSIREAHPDTEVYAKKNSIRDLGDMMRAINKFIFITCTCGMKIKIPPDYNESVFVCPRCSHEHLVPLVAMDEVEELTNIIEPEAQKEPATDETQKSVVYYKKKSEGWESYVCGCGNYLQLSPSAKNSDMTCFKCGQVIRVT